MLRFRRHNRQRERSGEKKRLQGGGCRYSGSGVRASNLSDCSRRADRIPLVIGVTGHRDPHPACVDRLRQQVKEFLLELHSTYAHTPLMLLSALADGADRIAARAALELSRERVEVRLVVPMPMPQQVYEEDFGADSLTEFRELLTQAWASIELPLHGEATADALRHDGALRIRQYETLGAFVNRQCQVLIGLWDGNPGLRGGTADVMQAKLRREVSASSGSLSALGEACPVCHVITPRAQSDGASDSDVRRRMIFPESMEYETNDQATAFFDARILRPLDAFNAEGADMYTTPSGPTGGLVSATELQRLSEAAPHSGLLSLQTHFVVADRLAGQYQRWARRALGIVSALVVAGAVALTLAMNFSAVSGGATIKYLSVAIYSVSLTFAASVYGRARRGEYENKYQDYRALAEALRVQFFWLLTGVDAEASDFYLGRQRAELTWIRNACRAVSLEVQMHFAQTGAHTLNLALKRWAISQRDYFERRAGELARSLARSRAAVQVIWISGVVLGLVLAASSLLTHMALTSAARGPALQAWLARDQEWYRVALVVLTASGVLAAVWHNYHERFSSEAQVKEYERMWKVYRFGCRKLEAAMAEGDLAAAGHELFVLGTEALAESAIWISKQREERLDDSLRIADQGAKIFEAAKRRMSRWRT
jgi:hypothetical protein